MAANKEIVIAAGGLYVIGHDRKPYRLGFAVGNEFSDHVMERKNYLYLAQKYRRKNQ